MEKAISKANADILKTMMEAEKNKVVGENVELARTVDSRMVVDAPKVFLLKDGPASVTYQTVQVRDPATLSPRFTIQTPSYQTGVSRRVLYRMVGRITVEGTNLDFLASSNRVALRAFPIHSCMSSLTLEVNDATISLGSLNQYLSGLTSIGRNSCAPASAQSLSDTAPDLFADYDSAVGVPGGPFEPVAAGPYSNFSRGSRTGGITAITVVSPTVMHVDVDITEPLIVQPFDYSEDGFEKAIYGVGTMNVNWSYQDVHRMLSLALGGTATVSNVSLTPSLQQLELSFVTPSDRSLMTVDRPYSYNQTNVQLFTNQLTNAPIPAGGTVSGASQVVELSTVPDKFLVYATLSEQDRQDRTQSIPDVYLALDSIQCQFGTRSGLLSSATPRLLWEITRRNGVDVPFPVWAGRTQIGSAGSQGRGAGGPLLIDAAADLGLPDGITPGMSTRIQFNITSATFTNTTGRTLNGVRLVVLALTDGVITNKMGSSVKESGIPSNIAKTPEEVKEKARDAATMETKELHSLMQNGGYGAGKVKDFFRGFARGFKKIFKPAAQVASMIFPEAAPALGVASEVADLIPGGTMLGGAPLGGAMLGGMSLREKFRRSEASLTPHGGIAEKSAVGRANSLRDMVRRIKERAD